MQQHNRWEKRAAQRRSVQTRPFSISWSKLASLFQANQALSQPEVIETNQSEQSEPDSIREQDLYPHFTDRVEPSLYYSIFFPPRAKRVSAAFNSSTAVG